jgi:hypothetical protein
MSYDRNGYEIYVVWQENVSSGNDEIYYRLNTNGIWGSNQNLSNTGGLSQNPYIAGFKPTSSTDTALVIWAEKGDVPELVEFSTWK